MDRSDFTDKAARVMERAGKPDCTEWPEGTISLGGIDRGGWGNFSFRSWWVPTPGAETGTTILWNSDDRDYSVGHYNVPKPERKTNDQ